MPVDFLTDDEAARFGRFDGVPARADLQRVFFLDDKDRTLVEKRRDDHNRLGFALLLTTARYLGTFLADPLDVPTVVVDYLAEQLGIADPSCVKQYTERRTTRFEHAEEIKTDRGLRDFTAVEAELEAWVDARAWTTGDGPKAIFTDATVWLREEDVLLPGVSTLTRLVARVRDAATTRLWDNLSALTTQEQRRMLRSLLVVPAGSRVSDLERWRRGPSRASGPSMIKALDRITQISGLGFEALNVDEVVPRRRLVELARYGMAGKATALERHPEPRKIATLLATVVHLEATATDDALDLLDLLLSTELVGKAKREADKATVRRHPQLARASSQLAAAMGVLFEATAGSEHMDLEEYLGGDRAGRVPDPAAGCGGHGHRHAAAPGRRRLHRLAQGPDRADRHGQRLPESPSGRHHVRREPRGRPRARRGPRPVCPAG